jgi:hypothetical protein
VYHKGPRMARIVMILALSLAFSAAAPAGSEPVVGTQPTFALPEPGTFLLAGTGILFGVGVWMRKRMK